MRALKLILLGIGMPVMDGIGLVNALLIITMLEDIPHLYRAVSAGAAGFLTKDVEAEELFFVL